MSDMRQLTALGRNIEDESFAVIDREAGAHGYPPGEWSVVRRRNLGLGPVRAAGHGGLDACLASEVPRGIA